MSEKRIQPSPTSSNPEAADPERKRLKTTTTTTISKQTNLLNFFSASHVPSPAAKHSKSSTSVPIKGSPATAKVTNNDTCSKSIHSLSIQQPTEQSDEPKDGKSTVEIKDIPTSINPIIPHQVPPRRDVVWLSQHDNKLLLRKVIKEEPRCKMAAFDLDGTLVTWNTKGGFWPSQLIHYELWSSTVITKLRQLHDDGYKLVLFSNQGGIQKAHGGKKATIVKMVVDWLASLIDRPVFCVMSTVSPKKAPNDSFHKPSNRMWFTMISVLNKGLSADLKTSFFVGDSALVDDDQGGVDRLFAEAVGISFHSPEDYFGPSHADQRQLRRGIQTQILSKTPTTALFARAALVGGYLQGPILLILCGVQGSGKSTFSKRLVELDNRSQRQVWVHLSQDTINNGKPGKREAVEKMARDALLDGQSVVVDRMHLNAEQRSHFVQLAQSLNVPAHIMLLNPPKHIISGRVRERSNHPGNVQGENGVKRAIHSLSTLVPPMYSEQVALISCSSTIAGASRICDYYKAIGHNAPQRSLQITLEDESQVSMPTIALGTMGIGKRVVKEVIDWAVSHGFRALDTAPTYKNEDKIGEVLASSNTLGEQLFCIVKIPKSVTHPEQVRLALESSLQNLRRNQADLLLLHWPSDVMASDTLTAVWSEMETCYKNKRCRALGVCNFNVGALHHLLSSCVIRPVVNQVERHPLLPQWDLVDFCAQNDILLQAHTPLGQGKSELLEHSVITKIQKEVGMSPAQICLQWNLQQGFAVVPKCSSPQHMQEVFSCSALSAKHMKELNEMGAQKQRRFVAPPFMFGNAPYCWDERIVKK